MGPWQYLPNPWRQALADLPHSRSATLEEVRFRVGRPLHLYGTDWSAPLLDSNIPAVVNSSDIERILSILVDHSLYARAEELRHGFITLPGGHRVGIAGHAVLKAGQIETLRNISGLNMRIGRVVMGPGEKLLERLRLRGVTVGSLLLVSPPRAGKTTLLRDLVRILSDQGRRLVIVDERSEVAGFGGAGASGYDVGYHTDVLDNWPKVEGIEAALRTLGPDVIAVDELGGPRDLEAIGLARYSGVDVIATVHARCFRDLWAKPHYRRLLDAQAFDALVLLSDQPHPGTLVDLWSKVVSDS